MEKNGDWDGGNKQPHRELLVSAYEQEEEEGLLFPRFFLRTAGGTHAALMLAELFRCLLNKKEQIITADEWERDLGLTPAQQRRARKQLRQRGLIVETVHHYYGKCIGYKLGSGFIEIMSHRVNENA